jgi:hypothetical protein
MGLDAHEKYTLNRGVIKNHAVEENRKNEN